MREGWPRKFALILIVQCRTLHADLNWQMLVQKGNTQRISEVHRAFSLFVLFFVLICLFVCFAKKTGSYSESTKGEGNCHFGSCFCNQSLDFLSCLLAENNNEMSS